jgi:hypothetical protein
MRPAQPAPFFSGRSSDLRDEKNVSGFFEPFQEIPVI